LTAIICEGLILVSEELDPHSMISNNTNSNKVALVTGSSSGIGLETSLTLAENNFRTYATMRNLNKASNIMELAKKRNVAVQITKLDVNDDYSVQQAVQQIVEEEKAIDLLVNNAGYTQLGTVEDLSLNEIQAQFNTNIFGIFRMIKEVAPIMRRQRTGGTIINIGSANGFFGVPCASAYVSTKFALEGLTQSLRFELSQFGIKVVIIEPGAIKTNAATNSMFLPKKLREQQHQLKSISFSEEMTKSIMNKSVAAIANGSSPKVVAEIVLKIVREKEPQWRYLAGVDAETLYKAKKDMNDQEFEKFLYKTLDL
jgi:NAD(P)-dependent dehydrogenase (short-subunit alcohol dehydrogenase family)